MQYTLGLPRGLVLYEGSTKFFSSFLNLPQLLRAPFISSSLTRVVLQPATRIPPQPSHIETPTHIETRTHDQCGDTIEKSQAPDDGCINVRNMLSTEEVK